MIQEKNILKMYFETGDKPTQTQYENLIDSLRHMHDKISLDDFNLNGYDEEGSRESNLMVRLGDFDNSNNGTQISIDDSDKEIKISGKLTVTDDAVNKLETEDMGLIVKGNQATRITLDTLVGNDTVINFDENGVQKAKLGFDSSDGLFKIITGTGPFSSDTFTLDSSGNTTQSGGANFGEDVSIQKKLTVNEILKINSFADAKLELNVAPEDSNDWNYISFNGADGARDAFVGTGDAGEFKIGNSNTGEEFIMSNFGGAHFTGNLTTQGLLTSNGFTVEGDDASIKIIRTNPSIGFDPVIVLGDGIINSQIRADRSSNGDIYFTTQNAVNEVFRIADSGDVTADNFVGNWNGKTESDFMRATGDVNQILDGDKTFEGAIVANSTAVLKGTANFQNNLTLLNKNSSAYVTWATRNTSGSEAVYDLSNIGSIVANNGITVSSTSNFGGNVNATGQTVTADNFIGNWNGKTESDFMRATGNVGQVITGEKSFSSDNTTFGTPGQYNSIALLGNSGNELQINYITTTDTARFEFGTSGNFEFEGELKSKEFKLHTLNTAPSSSSDNGTTGDIRFTADYIYVCTATDTWKRTALSTW